ncbi:uncharacterized protein EI90DRAFT_1944629 [Cantharellus anzutake]|uniref:uncharacterized protein n=1 Tax=Cantharellus anzutake TaxID=1750568 RepID=UPI001905F42F|nr:uncharacterized protein EI90DRAFT_1944629 [Cantharellus anzutake]KAF8326356.1 hypothetical protein EI90DRAFT_1944629 [Cantharellus anzutake]
MSAECGICSQEYGSDCVASSLRCGHVYCYQCLTELSRVSQRPLCPGCRKPFKFEKVIRLYIDFPEPSDKREQDQEGSSDPPPISVLTEEQRAESEALSQRLSVLGIETTPAILGSVLDDIRRWSQGVQTIKDIETQIAVTRLLLNVDLLRERLDHGSIPAICRRKRTHNEIMLKRDNLCLSAQVIDLNNSLQRVEMDLRTGITYRQELREELDHARRKYAASEKLKQLEGRTADSEKMLRKCSRLEVEVENLEKENAELRR